LDNFQNRMMNAASSVLGIPRTFFRAAAIMLPCQTGMIGTSRAATCWIWRMTAMRRASVFAACSGLSSAVSLGVSLPLELKLCFC
jgi:hypothetical protein